MNSQLATKLAISTRDRILDAAAARFSRHSYEETGLRDIAADVGVDVAYVHRSFGSKERLFAEAVAYTINVEPLLSEPPGRLANTLAKQLFASDLSREQGGPGQLDILIRSLTSPAATSVLRGFIMEAFISPLSTKLDQPSMRKVTIITALLAGLGIMRNVLELEPLLEGEGGELEADLTALVKTLIAAT